MFCIHDGIFDRIQSTHQDLNIILKFISNNPKENESHGEATDICYEKMKKKKRNILKINQVYSEEKEAENVR